MFFSAISLRRRMDKKRDTTRWECGSRSRSNRRALDRVNRYPAERTGDTPVLSLQTNRYALFTFLNRTSFSVTLTFF